MHEEPHGSFFSMAYRGQKTKVKLETDISGPVLGVDPGSRVTGYGVISYDGGSMRCLAFGALETKASAAFDERLYIIGQGLEQVIQTYKPVAFSLEKSFLGKNADSASKLGHVRGVCLYEARRGNVPVFEYNPTEVKAGLTGAGRASKDQVQSFVSAILGLPLMPKLDISDALALAIHHARYFSTLKKMKEMEMRH